MFGFLLQRSYCLVFGALALGIACGWHWPPGGELLVNGWWLYWLVIGSLALLWWRWRDNRCGHVQLLPYLIVTLLGYAATALAIHLAVSVPLSRWCDRESHRVEGRVVSIPRLRNGHLRFKLAIDEVDGEVAGGSCFAYLKSDGKLPLYYSDEIRLWASLSEVQPPLNRGEFNYRAYLIRKGTVFTAYAPSAGCLRRLSSGRPWPFAQIDTARDWLTGNMRRSIPGELGELAVSVVFGDKITAISDATQSRFRRAGLTHILVASGTQVSLVVALVSLLFWRFTMDFSIRGLLKGLTQFMVTMGVVLCYSAITGFETSIVRALSMGTLVLAGRLLHRDADGLSVLAQSGIVLLVINPLELFSAGFQLSFGATFGLIYLIGVVHPLYAAATATVRVVGGMLASTGGAQLFVAPLLAASFHQLSVWGMVSNLVAIPLAFWLLICGALLSCGAGYLPLFGWLLSWITTALCWLMDRWAGLFAALPGSDIAVPQQPLWWSVTCYALILLFAEWFKHRETITATTRRWLLAAGCALGGALIAGVLGWLLVPQPGLTVLALDGGQAYIWRPYTGQTVVLAAAERFNVRHNADKLLDALRWRGINRVHHWYWIDTEAELPSEYDSMRIDETTAVGGEVEELADMAWLVEGAGVSGAVFGLGRRRIYLHWDNQPTEEVEMQSAGCYGDWVVTGNKRLVYYSVNDASGVSPPAVYCPAEFSIRPSGLRKHAGKQ